MWNPFLSPEGPTFTRGVRGEKAMPLGFLARKSVVKEAFPEEKLSSWIAMRLLRKRFHIFTV
jgi:hypothetical protein